MRAVDVKRSLAAALALGSVAGAALLAACGGDDAFLVPGPATGDSGLDATSGDAATIVDATSGKDASTGDSSVGTPDGGDGGPAGMVSVDGGAPVTVYVGATASFDASAMATGGATPLYRWALTSAPAGSAVTSAAIEGASTPSVTVPTDAVGTYVYTVTVTAGSASATATFAVNAVAPDVVYVYGAVTDAGTSASLWSVAGDGTALHPITCLSGTIYPAKVFGSRPDAPASAAVAHVDVHEGAAGTASTVVATQPPLSDGGTSYGQLWISDTSRSCYDTTADSGAGDDAGVGDASAVPTTFGPGPRGTVVTVSSAADSVVLFRPRVSPDGTQVAVVSYRPFGQLSDSAVYVAAIDGSRSTFIAPLATDDVEGTGEYYGTAVHQVEWVDSTHVGWTRADTLDGGAVTSFVTASVPPVAGDPQLFMTCANFRNPSGIGYYADRALYLADGTVLTAGTFEDGGATSVADLVVLRPSAPGGSCSLVRNLSNLPANASVTGFALSPDGKTVAYLVATISGSSESLYLVPLDGSAAPLGSGGLAVASDLRWVGGGTQIAFTEVTDAGTGPAIVPLSSLLALAADAGDAGDGGEAGSTIDASALATQLVVGSDSNTVTAVGSGDGGCSSSGSSETSVPSAGFFAGLVAVAAMVRRRRGRS